MIISLILTFTPSPCPSPRHQIEIRMAPPSPLSSPPLSLISHHLPHLTIRSRLAWLWVVWAPPSTPLEATLPSRPPPRTLGQIPVCQVVICTCLPACQVLLFFFINYYSCFLFLVADFYIEYYIQLPFNITFNTAFNFYILM